VISSNYDSSRVLWLCLSGVWNAPCDVHLHYLRFSNQDNFADFQFIPVASSFIDLFFRVVYLRSAARIFVLWRYRLGVCSGNFNFGKSSLGMLKVCFVSLAGRIQVCSLHAVGQNKRWLGRTCRRFPSDAQ
jgi:hypothetical protein